MVDFAGWEMPLHYGSQIHEHHQVRRTAGMFDVSHMRMTDVEGPGAGKFLGRLLANDICRLAHPGQALYSCLLNEQGGIIDDLIVYTLDLTHYRMVSNAGTRDKVNAWLHAQATGVDVRLRERPDLGIIAVQGPLARALVTPLLSKELAKAARRLERFQAAWEGDWLVARTGYTGEDGFEIFLPGGECEALWEALRRAGVHPIGLGARDTLRLEAGMNLYGADMDEKVTPLECGLGWTIAWEPQEREFIGRARLETQRQKGPNQVQVGLVLLDKGVLRPHQRVETPGLGFGEITSGGFAPTLGRSIALARVPAGTVNPVRVEIRGQWLPAWVVKPPFVRNGHSCLPEEAVV